MSAERERSRASGGSLRRQLVGWSAAVTALAAVLLTLLVQLLIERTSTSSVEQVLRDRADSVVRSIERASTSSRLVVPDADLGAGVAVYDGAGRLIAGSAPPALASTYAELSTASAPTLSPEIAESDRARAQPFRLASGADGVVVVSERLGAYEEAEHYALVVSIGAGLLAVLASAALASWVSRRALRPVVAMADTASEWGEHDLGRRFDLGPPTNELTALAATLDEIKAAYRRKAVVTHPDRGGDHASMVKLNAAYETAVEYAAWRG